MYTEVEGYIYDAKTKNFLSASIQLVDMNSGKLFGTPFVVANGNYSAWTDQDPYKMGVQFKAPGHRTLNVSFEKLQQDANVYLAEGGGSLALAGSAALVLAAVMLYRKKTGKVGALKTEDLVPIFLILGGVLAFSQLKKLLETLGLWDSRDTKDLDHLQTDPGSFWNPNFWTTKPAGVPWTNPLTTQQAQQAAAAIYYAMGFFNDDEDQVIGVFHQISSQASASFIAYQFQAMYGKDLLTFLRGGLWPQDGLSDEDVNRITKYVSNLPKY